MRTSCLYNEKQERKPKDCLGWQFRYPNTRLPFFLSENVFCQGNVKLVLSDPVCVLFSGMLHVYKSDVSAAVFES